MNSKQRVKNTFLHKAVDRVPINYFANGEIDAKLKKHFGLEKDDDEGLRIALGVDFRAIGVKSDEILFEPDDIDIKNEYKVDPQWGIRTKWVEHPTGGYQDYIRFPLRGATIDDIRKWPFPNPDGFNYDALESAISMYSDYALYVGSAGLGDNMNSAGMLFSQEEVYAGMILEDPALLYYLDKRMEVMLEITKRSLEHSKAAIDFMWIGEDLGTQKAPIISLALFRKQIRPRLQKFVDLAHKFEIPVMIHSCGSSSWAFNDFIDMGITAVDTLQPEANDMSPEYLIDTYGDKLVYHGCISTAGPVAYGTVDETERYCKKTLEIMMQTKGYCFSPTHELQDNSHLENVLKMYECAQTYGQY